MSLRANHRRRTNKNEEQNRFYSVKTVRHVRIQRRDREEKERGKVESSEIFKLLKNRFRHAAYVD